MASFPQLLSCAGTSPGTEGCSPGSTVRPQDVRSPGLSPGMLVGPAPSTSVLRCIAFPFGRGRCLWGTVCTKQPMPLFKWELTEISKWPNTDIVICFVPARYTTHAHWTCTEVTVGSSQPPLPTDIISSSILLWNAAAVHRKPQQQVRRGWKVVIYSLKDLNEGLHTFDFGQDIHSAVHRKSDCTVTFYTSSADGARGIPAPWLHAGVFVQHWLIAESAIFSHKQFLTASWNSYEISHPSTGQLPTSLVCKIW